MKDKQIYLTTTQLFLRFLKKNGIYHAYFNEIHDEGKIKLNNAIKAAKSHHSNDILSFIEFNPNELLWVDMMGWGNDSQYLKFGHTKKFWDLIDKSWVKLWGDRKEDFENFRDNLYLINKKELLKIV